MSFGSKEILAISCSWCKAAYHNKESCFNVDRVKEPCSLGKFGCHLACLPRQLYAPLVEVKWVTFNDSDSRRLSPNSIPLCISDDPPCTYYPTAIRFVGCPCAILISFDLPPLVAPVPSSSSSFRPSPGRRLPTFSEGI